jgi:hypothetical protein
MRFDRLDATVAEVVEFLRDSGHQIHSPLVVEVTDDFAMVELLSGKAIVRRDKATHRLAVTAIRHWEF